ncbi:Holliday junction resolvase RuvX [Schleiferilactobacillus harbinensis]|jgi:putative Holliday junction resolvase|uniref:Putative pre-16S rRNA nuclease n=1 Tax=Schleiferilactobacillus harbinensis TaxID=304207 RepID=A0A5P2TTA4_9LACO|nr:Holliday junction resolvase RuvX [Schleiferilactobacillus harbinensis]HAY53644.1 Holliday junction resolvase RuvX [Lactobacillus sp.]MBO3092242.1 Holliday junction resolvase RuvX [Schleiferilactobacillus harbinensis]MCI1688718.1 Holliday junction resolvase RuvX [Schleiferilactobacillus harbinensis]MCI1850314.1 Holliday junction resolvase RuvX [Schleiferilactobacillus harbinensis]MCT2908892.1 Holliday junction resolvase RuvX [Schleiferilactobacillus harbinensis]
MRLMGLDVGSKTVGVAVSDPLGWTAQGVEIIPIDEHQHQFGLDRVAELVDQYEVTGFVLGFPKNMNNSIGERAKKSKAYGQYLTDRFHLPVDFIDERLTTVEANRMLIEGADASRKKRKQVVDKVAAVLILQNYLDAGGKLTKSVQ